MIYVVSDIHGCYDRYRKLLERIGLGPDDTLYVLGDVIDRGSDGFRILLDMAGRPNVMGLMGNHEAMAIDAIPYVLDAVSQVGNTALSEEGEEAVGLWFRNGGGVSLDSFLLLDADEARTAWGYMRDMPLHREVEAGGRQFVLVHGGLDGFAPSRPLDDYERDEIVWCRPEADQAYYTDKVLVVGHTPTWHFYREHGQRPLEAGIFRTGSFIDIDCGCVYPGGRLGCLCLDTMEEIYV